MRPEQNGSQQTLPGGGGVCCGGVQRSAEGEGFPGVDQVHIRDRAPVQGEDGLVTTPDLVSGGNLGQRVPRPHDVAAGSRGTTQWCARPGCSSRGIISISISRADSGAGGLPHHRRGNHTRGRAHTGRGRGHGTGGRRGGGRWHGSGGRRGGGRPGLRLHRGGVGGSQARAAHRPCALALAGENPLGHRDLRAFRGVLRCTRTAVGGPGAQGELQPPVNPLPVLIA